jgi:hypothetical protein
MKRLKTKRPILVELDWFFQWYNAPVHTAPSPGMNSCPQYPDPLPLALLVGPNASGRLVLALEGQAYGFQLGPEQPQERVGRGQKKNHRQRACHRLPAVV